MTRYLSDCEVFENIEEELLDEFYLKYFKEDCVEKD